MATVWRLCVGALLLACVPKGRIHPRAELNNARCVERMEAGALEEAKLLCEHACVYAPHYADCWVNLGLIAYRQRDLAGAKTAFIRAIRENPDSAQAFNNLCVIYQEARELRSARRACDNALEIDPDYAEARLNLALAHLLGGARDEGRRELRTLTLTHPWLARPFWELGGLALEERDAEGALALFAQAVALAPDIALAHRGMGDAYALLNQAAAAREAYRACLAADASMRPCAVGLSRLSP